jgi:hypothetical protein
LENLTFGRSPVADRLNAAATVSRWTSRHQYPPAPGNSIVGSSPVCSRNVWYTRRTTSGDTSSSNTISRGRIPSSFILLKYRTHWAAMSPLSTRMPTRSVSGCERMTRREFSSPTVSASTRSASSEAVPMRDTNRSIISYSASPSGRSSDWVALIISWPMVPIDWNRSG